MAFLFFNFGASLHFSICIRTKTSEEQVLCFASANDLCEVIQGLFLLTACFHLLGACCQAGW